MRVHPRLVPRVNPAAHKHFGNDIGSDSHRQSKTVPGDELTFPQIPESGPPSGTIPVAPAWRSE